MWKISSLSNLSVELKSMKVLVMLSNNNGQSHSVRLDISKEDLRKMTLEQIESVAIEQASLG